MQDAPRLDRVTAAPEARQQHAPKRAAQGQPETAPNGYTMVAERACSSASTLSFCGLINLQPIFRTLSFLIVFRQTQSSPYSFDGKTRVYADVIRLDAPFRRPAAIV
jgi:hypothetical protein